MHQTAFAWAGLEADYCAQQVSPRQLPARLEQLRQPDILGANLSLPHKEAALPLLDQLTDCARRIGAVNTVIRKEGGRLLGDNTDAPGLMSALQEAEMPAGTGPVVILGAGGAARAAVDTSLYSLKRPVFIVNRTAARATALAANLSNAPVKVYVATVEEVPWLDVSLIINSTSAGLDRPEESPLPGFDFRRCPQAALYDMVYRPATTRLMREARAGGLNVSNGLGMLAHQARLAFLAWTGVDVPVKVFLEALPQQVQA